MLKLLMSSSFGFDGTAESDDEVEVTEAARRDADDGRAEKADASLASDSSSRASADFMVYVGTKDFFVFDDDVSLAMKNVSTLFFTSLKLAHESRMVVESTVSLSPKMTSTLHPANHNPVIKPINHERGKKYYQPVGRRTVG